MLKQQYNLVHRMQVHIIVQAVCKVVYILHVVDNIHKYKFIVLLSLTKIVSRFKTRIFTVCWIKKYTIQQQQIYTWWAVQKFLRWYMVLIIKVFDKHLHTSSKVWQYFVSSDKSVPRIRYKFKERECLILTILL